VFPRQAASCLLRQTATVGSAREANVAVAAGMASISSRAGETASLPAASPGTPSSSGAAPVVRWRSNDPASIGGGPI
jgi:hypothetical protein